MENNKAAFVVIAEFEVSAENRREFLELCRYDAEHSVSDEPGCRQFDCSTAEESLESVVLYEVYDDRVAFDAHLQTPHYALFAEGVERLGVQKVRVRFFARQHS
ncbi:putative quinol monooxygenase [Granulicella cerasi]|uniref:Quinol monooxygenase n=1 Tax=Granulicella cerasi TaxID=741063 RepID=A0ABW1ZA69_9BACT|nr:putative quinol monooxygenase [Granulicella cerasi]